MVEIIKEKGQKEISFITYSKEIGIDVITYKEVVLYKGLRFLHGRSKEQSIPRLWEEMSGAPASSPIKKTPLQELIKELQSKTEEKEAEGIPLQQLVENFWNGNQVNIQLWRIDLVLQ